MSMKGHETAVPCAHRTICGAQSVHTETKKTLKKPEVIERRCKDDTAPDSNRRTKVVVFCGIGSEHKIPPEMIQGLQLHIH